MTTFLSVVLILSMLTVLARQAGSTATDAVASSLKPSSLENVNLQRSMLLIPEDASQRKLGQAKRGTRGWDQVMLAARKQAEGYTRALPVEHGYPSWV